MCIRLNIDCDYMLLFHVFIGVYFPGIIISSPDFQQIAEKDIHFRRCQRAADRQGSALSKHTAACFAPMWQNNQELKGKLLFSCFTVTFS